MYFNFIPYWYFERILIRIRTRNTVRNKLPPQVFHELVTTESNYVGVLDTVSRIAREAEDPEQQGGALLDQQEMKIIFGNLPLIQKVHTEMLKQLRQAAEEDSTMGFLCMDSVPIIWERFYNHKIIQKVI